MAGLWLPAPRLMTVTTLVSGWRVRRPLWLQVGPGGVLVLRSESGPRMMTGAPCPGSSGLFHQVRQ